VLTRLRVKNFKCFEDTGDLEIRPLTFLVGPNSSGKTSLAQPLLLLQLRVQFNGIEDLLAQSERRSDLGAYREFIFKHNVSRDLEVATEWGPVAGVPGFQFEVALRYEAASDQVRVRTSTHRCGGRWRQTVREEPGEQYAGEIQYVAGGEEKAIPLTDLKPRACFWPVLPSDPAQLSGVTEAVGVHSTDLFFPSRIHQVKHLGPVREYPKRSYVMTGETFDDVGVRGELAVPALWAALRSKDEDRRTVFSHAVRWLETLGIARELRLSGLGDSTMYQATVLDPETGVESSLPDVGFGVSQVLPVVVQCCMARPGSTVLIEQPEIHLHPRAQYDLGDLFIEAAQRGERTFLIETHSEHLLARVRRRIAERHHSLTRDDVAIYYFQPAPDGTRVQEIALKDNGQYDEGFPPGFFEEGVDEAVAHLEAIGKNGG